MEMSKLSDTSVFQQHESEVRGYCRRFGAVFASASGSIMRDVEGREYVDFLAACGSLNYGHNDPDMRTALVGYIADDGITIGLDLFTTAKRAFLDCFHGLILAPRGMDHRGQFTGPTGTNAVEAALKLARKVTGRNNVIAFTNGFHGVSLGSLAATGNKYNRMNAALPGVSRMPFDRYLQTDVNTADLVELMLADPSSGIDAPAAIILETVQGEGGLNAASPEWVQRIAALAKRYGALLIIDDVQAGCGRTGTFFSFEGMDVVPDLVVMAKSISGFGLPMALVLIKPEIDLWGPAEHNGTFRGNNHAFVTARVALEKFWSDSAFSRTVFEKSKVVTARLRRIAEMIPEAYVKGRGMMQGISVGSGELAEKICGLCFERGLIVETAGPYDEVIKILAPLTTPMSVLERGLRILEAAVAEVMGVTGLPIPVPQRVTVFGNKASPSLSL
jgi:diaminobutyrate-2-oxoglutarate transaminase